MEAFYYLIASQETNCPFFARSTYWRCRNQNGRWRPWTRRDDYTQIYALLASREKVTLTTSFLTKIMHSRFPYQNIMENCARLRQNRISFNANASFEFEKDKIHTRYALFNYLLKKLWSLFYGIKCVVFPH